MAAWGRVVNNLGVLETSLRAGALRQDSDATDSTMGIVGAVAMLAAVALSVLGLAAQIWAMPLVLFVMMIAYHGVRQGRSTYLVDISPENQRSAYAAVSNTVIGVLLLFAGFAGGGAALVGPTATLVFLRFWQQVRPLRQLV